MAEKLVPIPLPLQAKMLVGAGVYTEIVGIDAPSSAVAGATVGIVVRIKNTYSIAIGIIAGGALEYGVSPWPSIDIPDYQKNVDAGATESFMGSFVMPAKDVIIHAYSYYYTMQGWYFDDELTKKVSLGEIVAEFQTLSVTYAKA